MATKARQQYFADESSLQKDSREFSIADDVMQKINSIETGAQVNVIETVKVNGTALVPDANKAVDIDVPEVIDNLYTVDSDNALSAKQGKILYDYIQNIASRGRFLSNWNSATGLPMTNPSENPYPYKSGDYFIVSNVAGLGGTNYRPDGSSYVIGQASTVVETDGVDVSDFYFYDGTNWLLLKNSGRSSAVDSSLSTTSTNPVENRVITNALNGKQETLIAGNNIQIAADGKTISATNTTYSTATSSTSGLVKLGSDTVQSVAANAVSSTADRTYAVQLNSNDQMVVNVPWSDTTTGSATSSVAGTLKLNSDTVQSEAAQTVSSTSNRTYGLQVNSSGQGVINVPWTDTTYTGGTGINIDVNNEISNTLPGPTIAAAAPTGTEGALWYDTTNDVLMAHDGTNWKEVGTQMKILSYGHSTWQDFLDAYNKNAIVYCRASSNSNPGSGSQTRLAFMAYVNDATTPTSVEFQYYRSRSDHKSQANQLDQVFVYTLTPTSGGTWTVTERNTATKLLSGTGLSLTYDNSGNMTMAADTSVVATKTYVDEHDTVVSSTAPSSPTEGMVWYDTTNDQLKVYDGTNWNVTGKEYNAGEGIAIGSIQDYSAMQGPCSAGYHIPSKHEWQALFGILMVTFDRESDATTMGTYLKMPMAGNRSYLDANINDVGSDGYYWSSTPYNANIAAYSFYFTSYGLNYSYDFRAYGFSIRCFKDTPVIPTSSWTTLYDGSSIASGAGVFYNATDGLISVSGDGTTWYTIMDKNLGATTVFNQGDALTDANCGYFFQWGNNYGFAHSGNVTTSSTRVDASTYGPGNYFSSSTFITGSGDRSSVQNDNLWGATTGIVTIDNVIKNTGVLSVNGQTGNVTAGDMSYSDFNWTAKTGATITLSLASTITPSANFTVNAPSTIKDGQTYILRVDNGATAYTMTLGTNISNPFGTDLTLTANGVDQFVFLAIGGQLELQPEGGGGGGGGITNDTTGTTSTVTGIWAGSESEYSDLSIKSGTVLYFCF